MKMCVLCDARYFLLMTDAVCYIDAFMERKNQIEWKIANTKDSEKRVEKILHLFFKDCPNTVSYTHLRAHET